MSSSSSERSFGVADAKRRFSELLDRVATGERIEIHRRGRPAGVLVPAGTEPGGQRAAAPIGLAAVAGSLADWEELDAVVEELYAARRSARDRPAPELG